MDKKIITIIAVICVIIIVATCGIWYKSATQNNNQAANQLNIAQNNTSSSEVENTNSTSVELESSDTNDEIEKDEPIFTLENYPKVDASLAIHPLVDSIASNFLGIPTEDLTFEYTKTRSSDVYKNLIDGKVDVIFAAEPADQDYEYAKSKGIELEVRPVTSSAFVFIVNKDNPVDSLTLDQIVAIYKGDITNWKEVGGNDEEIIPYQRPNGSGSQTAMINLVMHDAALMTAPQMKVEAEMGGLVDAIAEYDNSKNAIGYSYFYYINTMYKSENIKMIAVNGVKPSIETIKNNQYPIYTNGFVVTVKGKETDEVNKWIETVTSSRGSKVIEDAGYVPMN